MTYNRDVIDVNYFQKAVNILAVLLIIGVVLPILQPKYGYGSNVEVIFINFKLLSESGVKFLLRLGAIYPLLAGMAILVINHPQNQMKLFTKSLVIMILSVLPFIFLFSESNIINQLGSTQGISNLLQSSVLGLIGLLLILSAGLALRSGRYSTIVKIIATVAASAYLISLLIPINNKLLIETYFDLLTYEGNSPGGLLNVMGLVSLISTGLLIAASIYSFMTWNVKYFNSKTGALITKLWIGAQVSILVGAAYTLIVTISESKHGEEIGLILLVIVKLVILIYGLILLASVSVANFITLLPESSTFSNSQVTFDHPSSARVDDSETIEKKLIKLKELFERNIISKEEYDYKKREYINKL
jgi:hypothetical protein